MKFMPFLVSLVLLTSFYYPSRADRLHYWFLKYDSPLVGYEEEFLQVADEFGLDWRLLPAITTAESGCANTNIDSNNNPFGWDSDQTKFYSYKAAIWLVGWKLAFGEYYYGKSIEEKLYTYNQNDGYPEKILGIMKMIKVRR